MDNNNYKNKNEIFASDLIDFKANIAEGQKLEHNTIALFCSPLFVEAMKVLMDKNIFTLSCGSGKERGILPGITGDFSKLSYENKAIANSMMISEFEFRIGYRIIDKITTFAEFEDKLLEVVNKFFEQ